LATALVLSTILIVVAALLAGWAAARGSAELSDSSR
jgi:hypothetical protein